MEAKQFEHVYILNYPYYHSKEDNKNESCTGPILIKNIKPIYYENPVKCDPGHKLKKVVDCFEFELFGNNKKCSVPGRGGLTILKYDDSVYDYLSKLKELNNKYIALEKEIIEKYGYQI